MLTTSMLLSGLRTGLPWTRARMATSALGSLASTSRRNPTARGICRLPVPVPLPVPRRPRVASLALLVSLAAAAALPGASFAQNSWGYDPAPSPRSQFEFTADGRLVDVQVQVEGRGTVPLYFAPGRFDRRYFQAFQGRNYSLVLRNNSNRRVGVLIAVDGLNVVNGERSGLSRHEPMYVLDPHESTVIRGWRTSLRSVRRFVFVDEERSYAERTGQANGDMGWIRVLAFREQRPYRAQGPKVRSDERDDWYGEAEPFESAPESGKNKAAPGAPSPTLQGQPPSRLHADRQEESAPGTGWGEHRYDPVGRTRFVAERSPVDHLILRYEYQRGLRQLGIRIWNGRDRIWERDRGELGFSRPPDW